ncbi:hypothetical protein [Streptomyces sp. NPDC093610]|uniref:MmyB family transcriptional regulator n=1 Tax=Streptomyces sp. NPDC093610 TaxID=3366048 RepID=UPI003810AC5C
MTTGDRVTAGVRTGPLAASLVVTAVRQQLLPNVPVLGHPHTDHVHVAVLDRGHDGFLSSNGAVPTGRVSPALRQLMDGYPNTPAFVMNRTLDLLAVNALAQALYSAFTPADNLARMAFLDPAGPTFYTDWNRAAQATVANLREATGFEPDNPRLRELVGTLTEQSADFARLWQSHTVRGKTQDAKHFLHPDVGPLTLTYQAFDVREAPGQQLVIYHAEPGSPSAHSLHLLGSLHATRRQDRSQHS